MLYQIYFLAPTFDDMLQKKGNYSTVPSLQFNGEKAAAYNRDFFSLIGP
jgi:hypothetical protein